VVYQDEPDDERNRERLAQHLAEYLHQQHQAVNELRSVVEQLQQAQQAGVNYGNMTQHNQTITNTAPNQGAQGSFHGPVTFHRQEQSGGVNFGSSGQFGDITIGDVVGGDKISGDKVGGDKISVGDVSGTGIAIGREAQAHVTTGSDQAAFAKAFAQIYTAINARPADPDVDKDEISETVKAIEAEAQKGEAANERKLTRWLHSLADMAEDIFDVTVAALTGPQAAAATVARRAAVQSKLPGDTTTRGPRPSVDPEGEKSK
jgi:hypothetical protein